MLWLHRSVHEMNVLLRFPPEQRSLDQVKINGCWPHLQNSPEISLLERHLRQCKCAIVRAQNVVQIKEDNRVSMFEPVSL